MSVQDIQPVGIQDKFSNWREKTNEVIAGLKETADIANAANVIDGNFAVTSTNGLDITVSGGYVRQDATVNVVNSDTFTLGASNTYAIYITLSIGSEALDVSLWSAVPTTGIILLYRITTDATSITNVEDRRTFAIGRVTSPAGSNLPIEELHYATEGQTEFTLSTCRTNDGIGVYVAGVRQAPDVDFSIVGDDTVILSAPMTAGTRVMFVSRDLIGNLKFIPKEDRQSSTPGQTVISVPTDLQPADESIAVYLDGVRQPREVLTFDEDANTITLSDPIAGVVDILLVRGDLAGTTEARFIPRGGAEGTVLAKQSGVDYDTDYSEIRTVNKIFNGAMLIGDEEVDSNLTSTYTQHTIDNLWIAVPAGVGALTYQTRLDKVSRAESRSLYASATQISGAGTINPIVYRMRVYGKEAASLVDANTVFHVKVTQDTGSNVSVSVRYLKLDGTIRDAFDFAGATYTQVVAPTSTVVSSGTPTDVYLRTSVSADVSNGMIVEVTVTASAIGTIQLSEFDLREGTVAHPFEPNYALDLSMAKVLSDVGNVELHSGDTVPRGKLYGDGSAYLISRFPRLAAKYNGMYDTPGTPVGYFRVPDLRGHFPRFYDERLVSNNDPNALDVVVTGSISGSTISSVSLSDLNKVCEGMLITVNTVVGVTLPAGTRVTRVYKNAAGTVGTIELSASATGTGTGTFNGISRVRADGTTSTTNSGNPVVGSAQEDVVKEHSHKALIQGGSGSTAYIPVATSGAGSVVDISQDVSSTGGQETRPLNIFLLPVICT